MNFAHKSFFFRHFVLTYHSFYGFMCNIDVADLIETPLLQDVVILSLSFRVLFLRQVFQHYIENWGKVFPQTEI